MKCQIREITRVALEDYMDSYQYEVYGNPNCTGIFLMSNEIETGFKFIQIIELYM